MSQDVHEHLTELATLLAITNKRLAVLLGDMENMNTTINFMEDRLNILEAAVEELYSERR